MVLKAQLGPGQCQNFARTNLHVQCAYVSINVKT